MKYFRYNYVLFDKTFLQPSQVCTIVKPTGNISFMKWVGLTITIVSSSLTFAILLLLTHLQENEDNTTNRALAMTFISIQGIWTTFSVVALLIFGFYINCQRKRVFNDFLFIAKEIRLLSLTTLFHFLSIVAFAVLRYAFIKYNTIHAIFLFCECLSITSINFTIFYIQTLYVVKANNKRKNLMIGCTTTTNVHNAKTISIYGQSSNSDSPRINSINNQFPTWNALITTSINFNTFMTHLIRHLSVENLVFVVETVQWKNYLIKQIHRYLKQMMHDFQHNYSSNSHNSISKTRMATEQEMFSFIENIKETITTVKHEFSVNVNIGNAIMTRLASESSAQFLNSSPVSKPQSPRSAGSKSANSNVIELVGYDSGNEDGDENENHNYENGHRKITVSIASETSKTQTFSTKTIELRKKRSTIDISSNNGIKEIMNQVSIGYNVALFDKIEQSSIIPKNIINNNNRSLDIINIVSHINQAIKLYEKYIKTNSAPYEINTSYFDRQRMHKFFETTMVETLRDLAINDGNNGNDISEIKKLAILLRLLYVFDPTLNTVHSLLDMCFREFKKTDQFEKLLAK